MQTKKYGPLANKFENTPLSRGHCATWHCRGGKFAVRVGYSKSYANDLFGFARFPSRVFVGDNRNFRASGWARIVSRIPERGRSAEWGVTGGGETRRRDFDADESASKTPERDDAPRRLSSNRTPKNGEPRADKWSIPRPLPGPHPNGGNYHRRLCRTPQTAIERSRTLEINKGLADGGWP